MPDEVDLNPVAVPKPKSRIRFWIWTTILCSIGTLLLVAIAAPCFVKARPTAQANSCIANMKQLDGAKEQWAMENDKTTNDTPDWPALIGTNNYIKTTPTCPAGGKYALNPVGKAPVCSLGTNVTPPHILSEWIH